MNIVVFVIQQEIVSFNLESQKEDNVKNVYMQQSVVNKYHYKICSVNLQILKKY